MPPRLKASLFEAICTSCLIFLLLYVFQNWHTVKKELKTLLYQHGVTNKRSSGHEKDESAQKMFEELLRMEEFSVALEKPEEPVLIPAWLRRFRTKSKGKTESKLA